MTEDIIYDTINTIIENENIDIDYIIKCIEFFRDIMELCVDYEQADYIRNFISPVLIINSINNNRKPEDVFWALLQ